MGAVLLWMIHVGIAQGSGFAPGQCVGLALMCCLCHTGICELEFVILGWERTNYFMLILHPCCQM